VSLNKETVAVLEELRQKKIAKVCGEIKGLLAQRNRDGQRTMPVLVEKLRLKPVPARRGSAKKRV
jgi:hypothetical protein